MMQSVSKTSGNGKTGTTRDFSQVQVINRAASILRAVRDSGGLNLSQLAREVKLARTTVYRIVDTLESEGLLTTSPLTGRIQLGLELVSLGAAVNSDLRRELHPYLEGLSVQVDETVDLAILNKDQLLFLDQVARPHRLRAVSGVGLTFPLHCTANGKAILSTLSQDEVMRMLPEQLEICTPNTIRTRDQLWLELETVRAMGVAYDREEHTQGICAVGAIVYSITGTAAAVSIPVPSVRFYGNEAIFASALRNTCEAINQRNKSL